MGFLGALYVKVIIKNLIKHEPNGKTFLNIGETEEREEVEIELCLYYKPYANRKIVFAKLHLNIF